MRASPAALLEYRLARAIPLNAGSLFPGRCYPVPMIQAVGAHVGLLVLALGVGAPVSACTSPASPKSPGAIQGTARVQQSLPKTLGFPRLGMWWPDPWVQSLEDIARYDWVILDEDASGFVAQIKAQRPGVLLLNSTNACEVAFDPGADADPADNAQALSVPPEWFLTQVGSRLSRPVDAEETVFHMDAMTVDDGDDTVELFIPGDTVLIGGESVLVEAVDVDARSMTVQRGYVRPAASHARGARIAAHITFWPDSWCSSRN